MLVGDFSSLVTAQGVSHGRVSPAQAKLEPRALELLSLARCGASGETRFPSLLTDIERPLKTCSNTQFQPAGFAESALQDDAADAAPRNDANPGP